jgi:hypothetical protein
MYWLRGSVVTAGDFFQRIVGLKPAVAQGFFVYLHINAVFSVHPSCRTM